LSEERISRQVSSQHWISLGVGFLVRVSILGVAAEREDMDGSVREKAAAPISHMWHVEVQHVSKIFNRHTN
jgi:hypothetical protein